MATAWLWSLAFLAASSNLVSTFLPKNITALSTQYAVKLSSISSSSDGRVFQVLARFHISHNSAGFCTKPIDVVKTS